MRYLSVCSGIEAASVAWQALRWECAGVAEIDKFASAVLAHRYPNVKNFGDFTKIGCDDVGAVDLLVGGTPCQSFSVAGKRLGMDDPRGNLAIEFLRLAARLRVKWILWENVPGVLSSNGGRDFGTFLRLLEECGYGWAYRVLDAQHFGVPQRRRRVYVVGYFGDWRPPAAVLFERESLRGDSTPSGKARKDVALCVTSRFGSGRNDPTAETYITHTLRGDGFDASEDGTGRGTPLVPVIFDEAQVTSPGNYSNPKPGDPAHPLARGSAHAALLAFSSKDYGADAGELSPTLRAMGHDGSHANAGGQVAVAFTMRTSDGEPQAGASEIAPAVRGSNGGSSRDMVAVVAPSLTAFNMDSRSPQSAEQQRIVAAVHSASSMVRRLTPKETERLQGLPDDWTLVPYRGKPARVGPRYKAVGNSMAVPVMSWLGERIEMACVRRAS